MGMDAWIEECEKGQNSGCEILYWRKFWSLHRVIKNRCGKDDEAYQWKIEKEQVLDIFRDVKTVRDNIYQLCKDFIPKTILNLPEEFNPFKVGNRILDYSPTVYCIIEFENYLKTEKTSEIPDKSYITENDVTEFIESHISEELLEKLDEISGNFPETQFGNPAGSADWILDIFSLYLELENLLNRWNDYCDYIYFASW